MTPSNYKTNLITVLVYRAFHICSTYISFHKQLLFIKEVLHDNCYPKYLIDRFIKRFLNKHFDPRPKPTTVQKMPLCFYMPYLGQISLQLRRKISRLLRKAYPCVDFSILTGETTPDFQGKEDSATPLGILSSFYSHETGYIN